MQVRREEGPRSAYCVRTCDGHYFPVRAQGDMNAAEMCQAFCPSAQTKIFSGGGIDYAVAPDRFTIAPDVEAALVAKYAHIGLLDTNELRLSRLCGSGAVAGSE